MYTRAIHQYNLQFFRGEELNVDQTALLNAALAPEEQFDLGELANQLLKCSTLSEMLQCTGITMEEFARTAYIDDETIDRWQTQPLTTLERDMVVYLLCSCIYEGGRTHWCQMCLSPFYGYYEKDCLCNECLSKLLLFLDGRSILSQQDM